MEVNKCKLHFTIKVTVRRQEAYKETKAGQPCDGEEALGILLAEREEVLLSITCLCYEGKNEGQFKS